MYIFKILYFIVEKGITVWVQLLKFALHCKKPMTVSVHAFQMLMLKNPVFFDVRFQFFSVSWTHFSKTLEVIQRLLCIHSEICEPQQIYKERSCYYVKIILSSLFWYVVKLRTAEHGSAEHGTPPHQTQNCKTQNTTIRSLMSGI